MEKLSPYEEQEFQRLVKSAKAETMAYYEKYNNMQKRVRYVEDSDVVTEPDVCVNNNINDTYINSVNIEDSSKRVAEDKKQQSGMNMQMDYNYQNMPKSNFLNNIFSRLDTEALLILAIAFLLYKENADTLTILVLVYIALG